MVIPLEERSKKQQVEKHTNGLGMRTRHASNSYRCITRLVVTGNRHYYAMSYTNFVQSVRIVHRTCPKRGGSYEHAWTMGPALLHERGTPPFATACLVRVGGGGGGGSPPWRRNPSAWVYDVPSSCRQEPHHQGC